MTHFETTGARKSFPCLDEPDKKAKFNVKLGRTSGMTAVSNMPKTSEENLGNDMVMDTFETSKIMSTYLLAFLVSDFSFTGSCDCRVRQKLHFKFPKGGFYWRFHLIHFGNFTFGQF